MQCQKFAQTKGTDLELQPDTSTTPTPDPAHNSPGKVSQECPAPSKHSNDNDASESPAPVGQARIIDRAPHVIGRPLCLIEGRAYAVNAVWVKQPDGQSQEVTIVVRDDGQIFTDAAIPDAKPISELEYPIGIHEMPRRDRLWSGTGVNRYLEERGPAPADTFHRIVAVVDRFMDFDRSLADQRTMCELTACYILSTYLLDAFNVIGYLWPNGEKGSGKTHFLFTVTELAYLGQVVLAGGTYASLRDLAEYGACLAFDDCENSLNSKGADPDKRAILLAGNRRGAIVTLKGPSGPRDWTLRHVHTFCPRMFSAIRLPDGVLASRTIVIPLVRSADSEKTIIAPQDSEAWPVDRRELVDDLWAVGLENLPRLKAHDVEAAQRAHLKGRDLEPWRSILAVALWLQTEHGVANLFDRMEELTGAYQVERGELEAGDPTRLLILALLSMFEKAKAEALEFETSKLQADMADLAFMNDSADPADKSFPNVNRVGWMLRRLRFEKASAGKTRRRWHANRADVEGLARSYGLAVPKEQNAENAENAEMQVGVSAYSALPAFPIGTAGTEMKFIPRPTGPVPHGSTGVAG